MGLTINLELDPQDQEGEFLEYIEKHMPASCFKNAKKLKKFFAGLIDDVPEFIKNGIIKTLLETRDPVGYLYLCIEQKNIWPGLIKEQIELGNHGIAVTRDRFVTGIRVKAPASWLKRENKWTTEDEIEILRKWVDSFVLTHNRKFDGSVMLFSDFGFSGAARGFVATLNGARSRNNK